MPSANWVLNKCVSVVVHPIGIKKDSFVIFGDLFIVSKKTSWSIYIPKSFEPSA